MTAVRDDRHHAAGSRGLSVPGETMTGMAGVPAAQSDKTATAIFGPKCVDCGWRGGKHRPPIQITDWAARPQWVAPEAVTPAKL